MREIRKRREGVLLVAFLSIAAVGAELSLRVIKELKAGRPRVRCAAVSPDRKLLASISEPERRGEWALLDIWRTKSWEPVRQECRWRWGGSGVAFSPDSKLLAVAGWAQYLPQGAIYLASIAEEFTILDRVNPDGLRARCVLFCPDGESIIVTSDRLRSAVLFEITKDLRLKRTREFKGHSGIITTMDISPDGRVLATGSEEQTVRLWSIAEGKLLKTLSEFRSTVTGVRFSPKGDLLAVSQYANRIALYRCSNWERIVEFHKRRQFGIFCVAFDPKDSLITAGTGIGTVLLWDVSARSLVASLKAHYAKVNSVLFCSDGRWLISAGSDGRILIWERK